MQTPLVCGPYSINLLNKPYKLSGSILDNGTALVMAEIINNAKMRFDGIELRGVPKTAIISGNTFHIAEDPVFYDQFSHSFPSMEGYDVPINSSNKDFYIIILLYEPN